MNEPSPVASPAVSTNIASRVAALAVSDAAEPAAVATPDAAAPPVAVADATSADSAAAHDPEAETKKKERELRLAEMEERLTKMREKNQARRLRKWADEEKAKIAADRQAVTTEKSRYDALRTGTFKETLEALGRDPRKAFEEMQKEAIEAGTPEGQIRQMRADFERQIGEKLGPLEDAVKKAHAEIARLNDERARGAEEMRATKFESAFTRDVQDPKYVDLRTEYDDGQLLGFVRHLDQNSELFYEKAREHSVRLTNPAKGYTMQEILTVLAAEHAAHEQGKQQRRARLQASSPGTASQAPTKAPSVNGTVASTNAGSTIGNDLAATTATRSGRRLSRQERIAAEVERTTRR